MADDTGGAGNGGEGTSNGAGPDEQQAQGSGPSDGNQGTPQGGTGAHSATPGVDDRSAEDLLTEAVNASDGGETTGKDELAAAKAEAAKWRDMARKQETRAKANAGKAQQFDAYQQSQMTEQQKLAAQLQDAQDRAKQAEGRYHRTLAAATYDLPPSMIDQLGDGTEEEISQRAEMFAAAINEKAAILAAAQAQASGQQQGQRPANGTQRPVESLRPGGLPASDNKPRDANQWFREVFAKK